MNKCTLMNKKYQRRLLKNLKNTVEKTGLTACEAVKMIRENTEKEARKRR